MLQENEELWLSASMEQSCRLQADEWAQWSEEEQKSLLLKVAQAEEE